LHDQGVIFFLKKRLLDCPIGNQQSVSLYVKKIKHPISIIVSLKEGK